MERSLPDAFRAGFWGPIFAEVPPSGSIGVDGPGRLPALPVVPQGVLHLRVEEAVEQRHGEALQHASTCVYQTNWIARIF